MPKAKLVNSRFMTGQKGKLADPKKVATLRGWCLARHGRMSKIARMLGVTPGAIINPLSGRTGCSLELYKIIKETALKLQELEKYEQ